MQQLLFTGRRLQTYSLQRRSAVKETALTPSIDITSEQSTVSSGVSISALHFQRSFLGEVGEMIGWIIFGLFILLGCYAAHQQERKELEEKQKADR